MVHGYTSVRVRYEQDLGELLIPFIVTSRNTRLRGLGTIALVAALFDIGLVSRVCANSRG